MFSLNGLDPTNSGSGGAAALGTYRTSDVMSVVLADGYFNEGAGNLRWTKVLFVQASDDQGFVLVNSNGDQVTVEAYNPLTPGTAVADATDETDVVAQFNALLASLRGSGVLQV